MKVADLKRDMDTQFAGMHERFVRIDERFTGMDERFAGIDERFARIDERFDTLRRDIEVLIRESEERTRRYFETVAEHFTSEMRRIVGDLADSQQQHARRGADAETRIDTLRAGLDDHEVRLQALERRTPAPGRPRRPR